MNAECAVGKKRKPSQDEEGLFDMNSFRMVFYGNLSFVFYIFYGIYRVNNVRAPVILMVGKEKPFTMIQLVTAYHLTHCEGLFVYKGEYENPFLKSGGPWWRRHHPASNYRFLSSAFNRHLTL